MMHGHGKSDSSIVPEKPPNEAVPEAKEAVEGRGLAKGKTLECNRFRTQSRQILSNTLERIRQARTKDGSERGYHSYSSTSIGVMTQGKSRMRQYRMSGSVRGAAREGGSYRDMLFRVPNNARTYQTAWLRHSRRSPAPKTTGTPEGTAEAATPKIFITIWTPQGPKRV